MCLFENDQGKTLSAYDRSMLLAAGMKQLFEVRRMMI